MTDNTNDPRLTAYALGELYGDALREVEALLARDPAARRAVDEIRATATLVAAELGREPPATLTELQRARIAAVAARGRRPFRIPRVYRIGPVASIAAASLVVGATAGALTAVRWMEPRPLQLDSGPSTASTAASRYFNGAGGGTGIYTISQGWAEGGQVRGQNGADGSGSDARVEAHDLQPLVGGASGGSGGGTEWQSGSSYWSKPGSGGGSGGGASLVEGLVRDRSLRRGGEGRGGGGLGQRPQPGAPGGADGHRGVSVLDTNAGYSYTFNSAGLPSIPIQYGGQAALGAGRGGDLSAEAPSTEAYAPIEDNPFRRVLDSPLSTFGADVDTGSYSNVRRLLNAGHLPPPGAVRIEEMVNYFPYDYAPPTDGRPFAVRVDVAGCPWKTDHRLVRIGLKGKVVDAPARPAANLVFLIDVSGSMDSPDKLPLLVASMKLLVEKLEARDRVAIVVYAGNSGLVLPSTACTDKAAIVAALDRLQAGGSTNGGAGIQLAYEIAAQNRIEGGVNRVVLATDGDFNVGVTDESSLVKLIEEKAKSGVFLSVLGFGTGNVKDATMEKLADRGNGNYAYVDTLKEGKKALVEQMAGTLVTIAKDVKLQVEFNPAQVGAWRLVGYENRVLDAQDFKDDAKDAGDIGAGHTVTALYELAPPTPANETPAVEPLKYQRPPQPNAAASRELLTVKLRWKEPDAAASTPMEVPVVDEGLSYSAASPDFKFAASVAAFGMCLRNSPHKGTATLDAVLELATEGAANDPGGWRAEFLGLVRRAKELGAK